MVGGFLIEFFILLVVGFYSLSLDFIFIFGDGGFNGDGNVVYIIIVEVLDEDGNIIIEILDLIVNDVD